MLFRSAKTVNIYIEYNIRKLSDCQQNFTIYYYPFPNSDAMGANFSWRKKSLKKLSTVAAGVRNNAIDTETLVIGPFHT